MIEKLRRLVELKVPVLTIADGIGVSDTTVYGWLKGKSATYKKYELQFNKWAKEYVQKISNIVEGNENDA